PPADLSTDPTPTYESAIRPILQARCVRCHGEKSLKADLDLRTSAGLMKGGESGPVIVPGKPADSLLYDKVLTGNMPPKKEGRLSQTEVAVIRRWILDGAKITPAQTVKTEPQTASVSQHDVIPIMLRRCTVCHGRHRQDGDLDLRTRAAILKGGK